MRAAVSADRVLSVHRLLSKRIRETILSEADERGIHENLDHYDMDAFSMHAKR